MANDLNEEKSPFLCRNHDDQQQDDEETFRQRPRRRSRSVKIHGILIIFQLLLFALNVGFFFILIYPATNLIQKVPGIEKAFSPARTEVPYEVETIDVYESSPFTGEPSHKVDVAWSDLLRSTQIRVTKDEMLQMNKTSVALRDGSGYLGYPEVLHQLHCVKRMYQYRHQDYYTHLNTHTFGLPHWDHCIEVLRRGIMCNADLTINTVEWRDGEIKGVSTHPRVCKDWGKFEEWADERALYFDSRDPGTVLVGDGEEGTYGPSDLL